MGESCEILQRVAQAALAHFPLAARKTGRGAPPALGDE